MLFLPNRLRSDSEVIQLKQIKIESKPLLLHCASLSFCFREVYLCLDSFHPFLYAFSNLVAQKASHF